MPNENVTTEDVKATAQAKAEEKFEEAKARFSNLTINQKLVLTAVAAVAASLVIQKFGKKLRPIRINTEKLIVVEPESVAR